jgi:glutathione transport system permease protein
LPDAELLPQTTSGRDTHLLIVAVLVFLFVHLLPGDPARLAAGPEADADTVELVRKDLGLDKPMPEQFVRSSRTPCGDFGTRCAASAPFRKRSASASCPRCT